MGRAASRRPIRPQATQEKRPVTRIRTEQLDRTKPRPGSERGGLAECLAMRVESFDDSTPWTLRRGAVRTAMPVSKG